MKLNYISIIALVGLLAFTACEETVTIDPKQVDPVTVIEGQVTDQTQRHYVRVTQTVDFYSNKGPEPVSNATVMVKDDEGHVYNYVYSYDGTDKGNGYYISENAFTGQVGTTYTLTVSFDGKSYEATDKLLPVTAIDSLEVTINEDEFEDPEDEGYFYEILFYAKEPQDREDYYLFKFYRNDSLLLEDETDIYFSDDEVLAENIDGIPTAGFYKEGDTARVEMYSLTKQAFIYYNDLVNLLKSDGGMFGSPPVNPRTNLNNGAMGYFQTSAVVSESIVSKLE